MVPDGLFWGVENEEVLRGLGVWAWELQRGDSGVCVRGFGVGRGCAGAGPQRHLVM